MPKAGRLADVCAGHGCFPPTTVASGSGDVSINGKPAARLGDSVVLHACPCPKMPHGIHGRGISAGSSNVSINGKAAARVGDAIGCGGSVAAGSPNVFIGETPYQSPVKACGESAVNNKFPLLSLYPMLMTPVQRFSDVLFTDKATTVAQRKARYAARQKLAAATKDIPELQAASERLGFNNDNILRAEAAQYVYDVDNSRRVGTELGPPPVGLELLDTRDIPGMEDAVVMDSDTGFGASLFKSDISGETMLTYRGTNNAHTGKQDWATNAKQGVGMETEQYNQAMDLADAAKYSLGTDVSMVGHSLGGGLASGAVGVTGNKGYTFNSAGLHESTVARRDGLSLEEISKRIETRAVDGEVLTLLQQNRKPLVAGLLSGIGSAILGPVAGIVVGLVASAALLTKGGLPEAAGNMQRLESIKGGSPISRHGMDQVIEGIELQKLQDIKTLSTFTGL